MTTTVERVDIERNARTRVARRGGRCRKHALGRAAGGSDARRDDTDVFPQVASGARPVSSSTSLGVEGFYDPTTGTFLSPDPLDGVPGTPTEANPYHYVNNDPVNLVDPLGLRPTDGHQEVCAAAFIGETMFFQRDPSMAATDLERGITDPSGCQRRLSTLDSCVNSGGQAWNWAESPYYHPWACGNWVPDCSTAIVPFFCDHGAILVKGGWTVFGVATVVAAVAGGNPAWGGCGIGAITGAWTGGDDVDEINASAVGNCIAGAGVASGNPALGCVAGAGGNVVATGFEPEITTMSIGCIFAAGSAAVGTAGSSSAPLIAVSAAWERVIQCALGGANTAITSQSEFGDAWEALMGCAGGTFTAGIDRS